MGEVKSIRLDEDLTYQIHQATEGNRGGLSSFINQAIKDQFARNVWVANLNIEKHAGLSAKELFSRVENVGYLRTSKSDLEFHLYPASSHELSINKKLYDYVHGEQNLLHEGFVYFNIQFPLDFFMYLKFTPWKEVNKAVIGFLAFLYWQDKDKRTIMEEDLEINTMKAVGKLFHSGFFDPLDRLKKTISNSPTAQIQKEYCELYFQKLIELGVSPQIFRYTGRILDKITYPFWFSDYYPVISNGLGVKLRTAYMRDIYDKSDDWQSIVINNNRKNDSLHSAESDSTPWHDWYHNYGYHHSV